MFGYGTLSYAYAVLTTYLLSLSKAETERRRCPKRRASTDEAAQRVHDELADHALGRRDSYGWLTTTAAPIADDGGRVSGYSRPISGCVRGSNRYPLSQGNRPCWSGHTICWRRTRSRP